MENVALSLPGDHDRESGRVCIANQQTVHTRLPIFWVSCDRGGAYPVGCCGDELVDDMPVQ